MPYGSAMWSTMVLHLLGRPPLVGGTPPMRCHALLPLLEGLFGISKNVLFQKYQNLFSLFTTTFFSVRSNWKYLCGLRTIPVPTKIIFNAFRNISRLVIFASEKLPNRFRQLRNISGFYPGKFSEVSRIILAPTQNYQ